MKYLDAIEEVSIENIETKKIKESNNIKNVKDLCIKLKANIEKNLNLDKAKFIDDVSQDKLGNIDTQNIFFVNRKLDDKLDAAVQISNALTMSLVGNALWAGLFFFWGIGFIVLGTVLVKQKKLNIIVDWIFVVFGALFVILLLMPWTLAQNIGFLIFGVMVLNTIAAGVFQLRENES